jgi:hypothetical protein
MPSDGLTKEQREWSRTNEDDHVKDYNDWANSEATQNVIAEFERSYKLSDYYSDEDCMKTVEEKLIEALESFKDRSGKDIGARAAFNETKRKWDKKVGNKGPRHDWQVHLKEMEEQRKKEEKRRKKEEREAKRRH